MDRVRVAIVGCGNIAPFYLKTLHLYPNLELIGIADANQGRSEKFSAYYGIPKYASLVDLLGDTKVELVVNLTNPRSHYPVSKACLDAGKHVYSEKPLAMSFLDAKQLVDLADEKGLYISSAPSRVLAETAQTMWKAIRKNAIGKVHLAYGEMDGGLVHRMNYKEWKNELDIPWPYKDEFEVGCTIEHAGYTVSWLTAFFGPVERVTAFASCQIPDKRTDVPLEIAAPDVSIAGLRFSSGVSARVTCSWIAPPNHSLWIYGEEGILFTKDIWKPRSAVRIKRNVTIGSRTFVMPFCRKYPFVAPTGSSPLVRARRFLGRPLKLIFRDIRARARHLRKRVDFCLGVAEVASAIRENRPCRLSAKYCLHNTEVVLAINNSIEKGSSYEVTTSFEPVDPMPWAKF